MAGTGSRTTACAPVHPPRRPTLTGLEPAVFDALRGRYLAHVDAHPTAVMPGKRRAFGTGSRKLSSTDRLTVALVTLRWHTSRSVLAGPLVVSTATISHTAHPWSTLRVRRTHRELPSHPV